MKVYNFEKRFGKIAVDKGFITYDQLIEALSIQIEENVMHNAHRLIGLILLDKGWIDSDQVKEVLLNIEYHMDKDVKPQLSFAEVSDEQM